MAVLIRVKKKPRLPDLNCNGTYSSTVCCSLDGTNAEILVCDMQKLIVSLFMQKIFKPLKGGNHSIL